ncbi:S41 family peptidase [Altererythrobacter sp.]|uniref:S41 family peptidase n=1 Tax=Altererythrobacter sp. TaxID=1872480 RepID=UPI003D14B139
MSMGRAMLSGTLAVALAACGGGGSGSGGGGPIAGGGGTPTPTPTPAQCSLADRQDWTLSVMNEWYLFPDLLDTGVNPSDHDTVQDYIDALVKPARDQNKDRFFTYITSIEEENALINSGSSAGFGVRLGYDSVNNRVFVIEAFEDAPGLDAGLDRGTELLSIGTSSTNLQTVSSLMASGGPQAVIDALGPSDPGVTRVIQFRTAGGVTSEQSIAKADYALDPISDRYGVKIFDDGGKKVGYLNLRTFIVSGASSQLRDAFQQFKDQGVTELIIDLRYNGGGLVSVAETLGDLLGADKVGQVFSHTVLRDSKSSENSTELFESESSAIAPTKIAFIGRGGTASASELVANSMIPYLGANTALIGTNTYGKPVGQYGFDRDACDDRLRVIAFKTTNRDDQGEYFDGLASVFPNTCSAGDDIFTQFGDVNESSIKVALDFLAGRSCTSITDAGGLRTTASAGARQELLQPERPNAAQHRIPGLF